MASVVSFPEPYPDEDFRSIIFRYHLRSVNVEFYQSRLELFGVRSYKQTAFPKNLNYFLNKLPVGHTFSLDDFIFGHTWYGIFKVFFTKERNEKMRKVIKYGIDTQRNPEGQPANGPQSILASATKYCPKCMEEDEEKYGEVYLHCQHQLTFLEVCPKHYLRLLSKCPVCNDPFFNMNNGVLLHARTCKNGHYLSSEYLCKDEAAISLQLALLDDLIFLRKNCQEFSVEIIHRKILDQLYLRGYIKKTGEVLKKELLFDFNNRFPAAVRKTIHTSNESTYFRNQLFKKDLMVNFIGFYLLLMKYLCGSAQKLIYAKNVQSEQADYLSVQRSRKQHSIEIAMNELRQAQQQISATNEFILKRAQMRQKMVEILDSNKFQKRSQARRHNEKVYKWLLKLDTQWLEERIPKKIERTSKKLNFEEIDQDLKIKIRAASESIDPNYPYPIKEGTVLRLLDPKDRNRFRHYAHDYLPDSKKEISRFIESSKQFLIRSIPRNYEKLTNQGITKMTISTFKQSSVSYYLNGDEEVERHILNFLKDKGALL